MLMSSRIEHHMLANHFKKAKFILKIYIDQKFINTEKQKFY